MFLLFLAVIVEMASSGSERRFTGLEVPLKVVVGLELPGGVESDRRLVTHSGGCHCGKVRWNVKAPAHLTVWDCNCSICRMKGNVHFIVPQSSFTLVSGEDALTTYRFNTGAAKHTFCKHCGVQSFYYPRSNPDGMGVQLFSVKSQTIIGVTVDRFDGQNWEDYFEQNRDVVSKKSKL